MIRFAQCRFALVLASFLVAIAGLLASNSTLHAANATVQIVKFSFVPADVTIEVGETVTWTNPEGKPHTSTNGTGFEDPNWGTLWNVFFLNGPEEVFSYTFDSAGIYPYFCLLHLDLGMTGTVTVVAPSSAEATTWGAIKGLYR